MRGHEQNGFVTSINIHVTPTFAQGLLILFKIDCPLLAGGGRLSCLVLAPNAVRVFANPAFFGRAPAI